MTVRYATASDAQGVSEILRVAFEEYRPLYTEGGFAATAIGPAEVLTRIGEGPVWVAMDEDRVIGTVAALLRENDCYLRGMAIAPESRGLGIGALLLEHVERFAVAHGAALLTLSTTPFLDRAIRLYERHGFAKSPEPMHDLFGTPLFTMIKRLA